MKRTQKILTKILLSIGLFTTLLIPSSAFAGLCDDISSGTDGWISCGDEATSFTEFQGGLQAPSTEGYDSGITRVTTVREYAVNVTNFVLGFLGLLGVIMIIYGGFLYLTAGGEQDMLDKGRKTIIFAVIGIVVVMASFAIVNTVIQAPEGEEDRPGVATGEAGEIAVDRSQRSFNLLANKVKTMARELITVYQNHVETLTELNSIKESIKGMGVSKSSGLDDWDDGIGSEVESKAPQFEQIQTRLNNIASSSKSSLLKKQVQNADRLWREIYNLGYQNALNEAQNNGCKDCDGGDCYCNDDEATDVLDKMEIAVRQVKAILIGEKIDDIDPYDEQALSHLSDSTKADQKSISLSQYDGTLTEGKCTNELHVGVECLKVYSSEGFFLEVNKIKNDIKDIYAQIADVTSIGDEYFDLLIKLDDLKAAVSGEMTIAEASGGLQDLKTTVKESNLIEAENQIKQVIAAMIQVIEALKNIKFVDAIIEADSNEGNAPFIVNFSSLNSYDPSNITIGANEDSADMQVQWDIDGNGVYFDEVDNQGSVVCAGFKEDSLAPSCIFKKVGSYRVALKVRSSHAQNEATGRFYDQEIAEGRAFMTIKVNPPTTKIILRARSNAEAKDFVYIRKYDKVSGQLIVDRDQISFTETEAKTGNANKGIAFSVTESEEVAGQKKAGYIQRIKWDFGDNSQTEGYSESSGQQATDLEVYHQYPQGKYRVIAEISNEKNQVDRVIFDLLIKKIKADLKVLPGLNVKMGSEVSLDARGSKVDSGEIVNFEWTINEKVSDELKDKSQGTLVIKDVETEISLKVTANTPNGPAEDTMTVTLLAESEPPVSNFSYEIPDENKPSQVYFNGGLSYDPDMASDSELEYKWDFNGKDGQDFKFVEDSSETSRRPIVQYLKKGTYDVTLTVNDKVEKDKTSEMTQAVKIKNVLSAWWTQESQISGQLSKSDPADIEKPDGTTEVLPSDKKAEADVKFILGQLNVSSVEWDFGDGQTGITDQVSGNDPIEMTHPYTKAGKYRVGVTVFDKDDDDLLITRRIFIGPGDNPIAAPRIHADGIEQFNFEQFPAGDHAKEIVVTRNTVLTFDSSDSLNVDGTGRKLRYEWQFGDGKNSTQKTLTHTYKDVDLMVGGQVDEDGITYKVYFGKLIVRDKDDSTKKDEVEFAIKVVSAKPTLKSLTAVIEGSSMETPLDAKIQAIDAVDEDGQIIQYRWFYYDVNESDTVLGQLITKTPNTKIKIGPRGTPGEEKTYRFDVEMTDSENTKVLASDLLPEAILPTVTVTNGPNDPPVAKFSVDKTSVNVGDTLNFVSTSTDKDGEIIEYMWDLDGDGFENDKWTEDATVEHKFIKSAVNGVKIRLKVKDNNYTEAVSKEILIFVNSDAQKPTAAFTYKQTGDTKQIELINNSEADEVNGAMIESIIWDFDVASTLQSADSDGDGKKDNDEDSDKEMPKFTYDEYGTYKVKLTIIDSEGNTDDVTNIVNVMAPKPEDPLTPPAPPTMPPATPTTPPSTPKTPVVPSVALEARLKSIPYPSPSDNKIHIPGIMGDVTFDISESQGEIVKYSIDKNILFDTNGNGINDDDDDFTTKYPIKWTTHFENSWGRITVKLTVFDSKGNKDSVTKEIVFDVPLGGANIFASGEIGRMMPAIGIALMALFTGIAIKFKNNG